MARSGAGLYILKDKKALPVYDTVKWALWYETADRRVAWTELQNPEPFYSIDKRRAKADAERAKQLGMSHYPVEDIRLYTRKITVSTVFLGLDHASGDGPPLLFETMVFNGPLHNDMDRYSNWTEAEMGHDAMVSRIAQALREQEITRARIDRGT
jgi:hypothetical protein